MTKTIANARFSKVAQTPLPLPLPSFDINSPKASRKTLITRIFRQDASGGAGPPTRRCARSGCASCRLTRVIAGG